MATYVLGALGTAIGGPIGGIIGAALGGLADRMLISALTPNQYTTNTGPRLTELSLTTSTEGATIPRVYGRCRFGGQVIWCAQFKEHEVKKTEEVGGKGGGGSQEVTTISYTYSLSFAVAFCEGNKMAHLGRVWIDSVETDLSKYNFRFHPGSESQQPDPTIEAVEGANKVSAYRGVSYLVFEDLPLAEFGNRLPQITAEIVVPLDTNDADDLTNSGKAWQLIPATGESIYGTQKYTRSVTEDGETVKIKENMHNNFNRPDAEVALDILTDVQPNLDKVSVVISWFGTDLRAGNCRIIPKIEGTYRTVEPTDWAVAGYNRSNAEVVSYDDKGNPIFGGTPSDVTVREIVQHIKNDLGKKVMFYPFILMDIPEDNTKPNPYSNNASQNGQPVFPWRGRITCSPAPGYTGSPDKTATAGTQVGDFFTNSEGYRQMVLHYANLLDDLLGNGDVFIIGSELVGLTSVRSSSSNFPAVDRLKTLAADVSAILPSNVKIGYAADWSEYHSYRPADGTNDVYFNMDPLWADSNIDFVGIDNYLPLSDWREGPSHLDYDAVNGPVTIYDRDYLRSNIEGGEYFDWYYASSADRTNQVRTPIADVAYSKPWVFRQKDIRSWWNNTHKNRPAGVESGGTTSWTAGMKPIWFTEFGCPAIDKGTNQPNVFYDPKSSESFFPYFSRGVRDDFIQRLYAEVMIAYWRDNGGSMLNDANMFLWTWDARPFPAYPMRTDVWSDGPQWVLGHWLSGRIDGAVLARLVRQLCLDAGLSSSQIDVEGLYGPEGIVRGLLINSAMTTRDILQSLAEAYEFKGFESEGKLKFVMDINQRSTELSINSLVLTEGAAAPVKITRGQETELPRMVNVSYLDETNSYQAASVDGHKGTGTSQNTTSVNFPLVWNDAHARALATSLLFKAWAARERGEFALPPSFARMDVGDLVYIPVGSRAVPGQLTDVTDTGHRQIEFTGFDVALLASPSFETDIKLPDVTSVIPKVLLQFMNIPLLLDSEASPHSMRLAAGASDGAWPGGVNVLRSDGGSGFLTVQTVGNRTSMGTLTGDLYPGPTNVWDRSGEIYVSMLSGGLTSLSEDGLLLGGTLNAAAIQNSVTGEWEVLSFATATLLGPGSYKLTGLIRGQLGTEHVARNPYPSGSRIVFVDPATVVALNVAKNVAMASTLYRWGPSSSVSTDDTYVEGTRTGTLAGLRPYSPCDFRVQRNSANDDLALTWKRRTRAGGDNWEAIEVPLFEESEQYKLEIYDSTGVTLKRTEVLTSPSYTYTAANQTTDQGSVQTDVFVRVYQFGADYGNYGPPLEGRFYMEGSF